MRPSGTTFTGMWEPFTLLLREWALPLGLAVISVEYRLAPRVRHRLQPDAERARPDTVADLGDERPVGLTPFAASHASTAGCPRAGSRHSAGNADRRSSRVASSGRA
ncbi:hypothetical protein ADK53_18850 [Streptomyces sp. WM6373]|nr:hypothetical protein ADK53_18850 [Streptomyces sp. WM6373]KOU74117.1 hypothetical protein ADK96_04530 [Streptomyces sp. IGB124]KOU79570.1 hypothetical protein ADK93_34505 [Streptomyces sp. XY58]KOV05999.1 hypothetical protein ADK89_16925 [Streptomyces sp. XY37]KOV17110.1 hypothetical protein ADK90_25410 [Streptomyces sp. XY413]KOV27888.1 hypothetical protein ADK97_36085 [Streptomyces sp. H021]KOV48343.1 hypothetical protein ADK99_16245 [Streptomyces sp. MMG1064]